MTVRVYVPATSSELARLVADRALAGPLPAHAVTDALVREWPEADDEQREYAALMAAAAASRARRAEGDRPRRHVVAADVEDAPAATGTGGAEAPTLVEVAGLTWAQVAAVHVDLADDVDEDEDLAWFATQEIDELV